MISKYAIEFGVRTDDYSLVRKILSEEIRDLSHKTFWIDRISGFNGYVTIDFFETQKREGSVSIEVKRFKRRSRSSKGYDISILMNSENDSLAKQTAQKLEKWLTNRLINNKKMAELNQV